MDKNNFSQKLAELTALAAVSENKLQMTQVLDAFAKEQVTPEEMESVYAKLEKKGIQILTEGEEGDLADESLLLDDGDDSVKGRNCIQLCPFRAQIQIVVFT